MSAQTITNNTHIPEGLLNLVRVYMYSKHTGMLALANEVKKDIDSELRTLGLDLHTVYLSFGDDDPMVQKELKGGLESQEKFPF